jgi:hypothetical protein
MKFIIPLLFIFTGNGFSKEHNCDLDKTLPKVIESCEGEACGFYHYDRALSDITLYENPSTNSKVVGHIKRCDRFYELKPIMLMKSLGKAKINIPNQVLKEKNVKKGDIVKIAQYTGEGYLLLCLEGKTNIDAAMKGLRAKSEVYIADVSILKNTKNEAWVRLKNSKGVSGFSPRTNKTIMWYATYDDKKLCHPSHKKLVKDRF